MPGTNDPKPESKYWAQVKPLSQSNSISCGQTSCAMAVNWLMNRNLTDRDFDARYGFNLLRGMNVECKGKYNWKDLGNFSPDKWADLDHRLQNGLVVIIGLNGPVFSPSGHGHIVLLTKIDGEKVTFCDPNANNVDGKLVRTVTKKQIEDAKPHPQGKFIFACDKIPKPE